jgi:CHAT domain-containing protein
LLAYGDPDFSVRLADAGRGLYIPIRSTSFDAVRETPKGLGFNRLPYSGLEATLIGEIFSPEAEVREGMMASEERVRAEAPGHWVIHLASHCLLDPKSPLDSALVLSIPHEPEPGNDGFLKAWEVFGLDLSGCDLVTLSACETAKGERLSGEGIIGLTRAFMYAGTASVLCSQWKVADDSAAALMVRFYTRYRDGDSKDVALQKAMREIRTGTLDDGSPLKLPAELGKWRPQWAHPYHWAPFILMGEYLQTATNP